MKNKQFKGIKVLVCDGNTRQCETILYELHKLGCIVTTINYSKLDVGYASRFPKHRILEPKAENDSSYLENIIEREVLSKKYDVIFPLIEVSSIIVCKNYNRYKEYIKITMPDPESFMQAYDKQKTFIKCKENGIVCPETRFDDEDIESFINRVGFPLAMKPRSGLGSKGFHKACSREEFYEIIKKFNIDIDKYVIQEFVENSTYQYNTYFFIDDFGNVKTGIVAEDSRPYPVGVGGTPGFFRTVYREDIIEPTIKLLKAMNYHGYAAVCFIASDDDKIPKVMEINGRISGSIRVENYCGCNISLQHLQRAFGVDVYDFGINKKVNLKIKHTHTDILWFFKCKDRFKTKPCFFNIWKTKDMIFHFTDPWPFLSYGIQGIKRYRKVMKEKER